MTRPLLNKSLGDLTEIVTRNLDNLAELELVRSELIHRRTEGARRLMSSIEQRIAKIKTDKRRGYHDNHNEGSSMSAVESELSDQVREWTNEAVAKLRAKLIDLSRRSPLISFKHASRNASQLRFVDERIDTLWKTLCEDAMGFEPLPGEEQLPPDEQTAQFRITYERARLTDEVFQVATEKLGDHEGDAKAWQVAERDLRARVREQLGLPKLNYGAGVDVAAIAKAHGFDPSFELKFSDDGEMSVHHEDDKIRVLLTRKELEKRLKTIWDRSGSHLRETGLHTLHLVFGFIQWFEDEASSLPLQAPLLLMPVGLEREVKRGRYEYSLKVMGDELEVNMAIVEKARSHWGLELPKLRNEESPESYFIRTRGVLEKGSRLKLSSFVTLAVLPPMILWKDLDPEAWPDDAFAKHRVLPGMLGAKEFNQPSGDENEIDIDDPIHAERVPALITDADASQHRAIMDMAAGNDMAIEGPPGTGKSQTITNMIATALAAGKRVLFVAEKQAALRVVADRLRSAGFGPLLLELHGDRAIRSDVYEGIRERLDHRLTSDSARLDQKRSELQRHRDMLRRYLALIGEPLGALGTSAHDLAWREIRLAAAFTREQITIMGARWSPADIDKIDRATLTKRREMLEQFGQALSALDGGGDRTRWTFAKELGAFDQSNALEAAVSTAQAAEKVTAEANKLAEFGLSLPAADGDYKAFSRLLAELKPFTINDEDIVISALRATDLAREIMGVQREWLAIGADLSTRVEQLASITGMEIDELAQALAIDNCPDTPRHGAQCIGQSTSLIGKLTSAEHDITRLGEQLRQGLSTQLDVCISVSQAIQQLGALGSKAASMLGADLLDPAALAVIEAAHKEASALQKERAAVLEFANSDALKTDPPELDAIADTLEMTGFFGRLSGSYRATVRQAARHLVGPSKRIETAAILRRVAALSRDVREFEQISKAKALFPVLLWEGVDSDFTALHTACELVTRTYNELTGLDQDEVLTRWLGSDMMDRQRFAASCSRISVLFKEASSAGFHDIVAGELVAKCQDRLRLLQRLDAAAKAATLRPDTDLYWDGKSVSDHLSLYQSHQEHFDRLRQHELFSWVSEITSDLNPLDQSLTDVAALKGVTGSHDLMELLRQASTPVELLRNWVTAAPSLSASLARWEIAAQRLEMLVGTVAVDFAETGDWSAIAAIFYALSQDRHGAGLAADLLKYRKALADCGLDVFGAAAIEKLVDANQVDDMYEMLVISGILRAYLGGSGSELSRLGSLSLDAARKAFKRSDRELHKLEAAAIVSARLKDTVPVGKSYGRRSDYTDLSLIKHEVELTRPRTPLRDVVHRAGTALQVLKPIWMMSPTSVAQFIRPGDLDFDLLIVDEASQMRPEYSVSCMLRANQFVVVGDANQLPPSDHFQIAGTTDGDDDGIGVDESTESILDLANQRFFKKPRLKWHYRSQHESLIQFSNREFYDRDLVVFPSPNSNDDDLLGVKCVYVPGLHADTAYEASINQREAEVIIEHAFGLMQSHPERSIGIVAMNAKQTELIQNEFDRLIVEEERVAKYVEAFSDGVEEFFIKNLENVQGDERDIILISTVYGPGKDGKVRQNFGLMNREVGWRRLNVLVTRAKMSCRLITSLRPDDVKVTDNSSRGVIALKSYLTYAHNGAQYDDASGGETDSDFEIFVADAIRAAGYEVVYQVGVEKFRIDLGIRHESCPIGFIAGVECDGAPYHTGFSVRDRDHIRQSVLEGLGWRIYRIWSTDWFSDSARETAKLIAWLDSIRAEVVSSLSVSLSSKAQPALVTQKQNIIVPDALERDIVPVPESSVTLPLADKLSGEHEGIREPRGRKLRSLDDLDPYEAIRGSLYEIWKADTYLGEVAVIKRATTNPRLYGDKAITTQSEYEGRVFGNGERFVSYDLYAAMREVARRAVVSDATLEKKIPSQSTPTQLFP